MTKVTDGVYFIEGRDDMIPDSHAYIIGKPETSDLSMIDAGLVGKGADKLRAIEKEGIKLEDIKSGSVTLPKTTEVSEFSIYTHKILDKYVRS